MPLMRPEKLREIALRHCNAAMSNLVEGDMYCMPESDACEWDPILRRHVYTQSVNVWRNFDDIEITVSSEGRILAFRDQHRFREARFEQLEDIDIITIARTTGLIGGSARVERSYAGAEGMLTAVISQKEIDKPSRVVFTINPTLRQIAEFTVSEE